MGIFNKSDLTLTNSPPEPIPIKPLPPIPVVTPPIPQTLIGVDISGANGDIDWQRVAASGIKFAFIKATEGITYVDPKFHQNWANARSAGVICSPYHFFHPGDDAQKSSKAFLDVIGELKDTDLPPMLDWEVLDHTSIQDGVKCAKDWLDLVEFATKKTPIFYSYYSFFKELNLTLNFKKYPFYVAEPSFKNVLLVSPWDKATFWQYSWTGRVDGINTKVDMDKFFGSYADLIKLAEGH